MHLALLCSFLMMAGEPTSSWPRFRGPNGSGQGVGLAWPEQWNKDAILWKVEVPGAGHGSPIIHDHRIYLQAADGAGRQRMILCLSSTDGKVIWQQNVSGKRAAMHKKNSLASGTGVTDGKIVCFCHWDGSDVHLAAYQCSDGKPLWSLPLGKHESQHGAGYSPILAQGKVIVAYDGDNHAEVFCVDAQTGKKSWSQQRQVFRASYCTPLIRSTPQGEEVVVASTAGITAYDLSTGQLHWNWTWPFASKPLRSVSSPVLVAGDALLASAGDGGGDRDTIALRLPHGDTTEDRQPRLLWQLRRDVPYVTCMLELKNHVYFVADKGVASCLDLNTGKERWSQRLTGNFTSSPLLIDDRIVAVNEDGELFIFKADSNSYQPVGRLKLEDGALATPALADGRLFVRTEKYLFCLGAGK